MFITRWRKEQLFNLIGPFRSVHVIVQDGAIDIVDIVDIAQGEADTRLDQARLRRLQLRVAEGDLHHTRGMLELGFKFENLR